MPKHDIDMTVECHLCQAPMKLLCPWIQKDFDDVHPRPPRLVGHQWKCPKGHITYIPIAGASTHAKA